MVMQDWTDDEGELAEMNQRILFNFEKFVQLSPNTDRAAQGQEAQLVKFIKSQPGYSRPIIPRDGPPRSLKKTQGTQGPAAEQPRSGAAGARDAAASRGAGEGEREGSGAGEQTTGPSHHAGNAASTQSSPSAPKVAARDSSQEAQRGGGVSASEASEGKDGGEAGAKDGKKKKKKKGKQGA